MTSKKRKYGDLSANPLPTESAELIDDVFAAFTGARRAPADSPSILDSPTTPDSLSAGQPVAGPQDSPSKPSSPPRKDRPSNVDSPKAVNLVDSLPAVRGHFEQPHRYTDHLCRLLSADEQAVYVQLYRLSWGWGKETCFISNPRLSERSNVPQTSMRRAVKKLVAKGLVEKTGRTFGGGQTEQGIEYRVFNLAGPSNVDKPSRSDSPSNVAPNKIEAFKESSQRDFSQCPDCYGTRMWYPEGTSKGVARCQHKRLPS